METTKEFRNHKILNHTIIGGILLLAFAILLFPNIVQIFSFGTYHILGNLIPVTLVPDLCEIGLTVLIWIIYRKWFQGQFQGGFVRENLKKGLLMIALPTILLAGMNMVGIAAYGIGNIPAALVMGIAPGIFEEVAFRGLIISNSMRTVNSYKGIVLVLISTSVSFGLVHFMNILAGADVNQTITQVCYAIGLGCIFAAAYLRTGNLWVTVIAHSAIDTSAFLTKGLQQASGVLTESTSQIDWTMVSMGIAFAIIGLFFIRPSKKGEILQVWNKRWHKEN